MTNIELLHMNPAGPDVFATCRLGVETMLPLADDEDTNIFHPPTDELTTEYTDICTGHTAARYPTSIRVFVP